MFDLLIHLKTKKTMTTSYFFYLFLFKVLRNNSYKLSPWYGIFIGSIIVLPSKYPKSMFFCKIAYRSVARHIKTIEYNEIYEHHCRFDFGLYTFSCAKHMLWNKLALSIYCKLSCPCIVVACGFIVISKSYFLQVSWTFALSKRILHLKHFTVDAFYTNKTIHCNRT